MTTYLKLQQARDNCMWCNDEVASEHYVAAIQWDGTYIYVDSQSTDLQHAVTDAVKCICIAEVDGKGQLVTKDGVEVLRSVDGSIWLDSNMEDEVFSSCKAASEVELNMTHAEIIQSAIDETGIDCTMVNDYSGRSMYGATCVGITGYHGDCLQTVAAAIKMARDMLAEYEFDVFVDVIMNFKTDNMGRGEILYWPGIECDDEPDSQ